MADFGLAPGESVATAADFGLASGEPVATERVSRLHRHRASPARPHMRRVRSRRCSNHSFRRITGRRSTRPRSSAGTR